MNCTVERLINRYSRRGRWGYIQAPREKERERGLGKKLLAGHGRENNKKHFWGEKKEDGSTLDRGREEHMAKEKRGTE